MGTIEIDRKDLQARDRRITELTQRVEELSQQIASGGAGGGQGQQNSVFTKEDEEALGEMYAPLKRLEKVLLSGISSLDQRLTDVTGNVTKQSSNLFSDMAATSLTGYAEKHNTEQFNTLLEKEVPGLGGVTYGDAWTDAIKNKRLKQMQDILDMVEVKKDTDKTEPNFEPQGGQPPSDAAVIPQRFKYKVSDILERYRAYNSGEIPTPEWDEYEKQVKDAIEKNEVFNDVETPQKE